MTGGMMTPAPASDSRRRDGLDGFQRRLEAR